MCFFNDVSIRLNLVSHFKSLRQFKHNLQIMKNAVIYRASVNNTCILQDLYIQDAWTILNLDIFSDNQSHFYQLLT